MALAKGGRRVAVVEAMGQVGGNCLHYGTIPSKALRHSVQLVADYRRHPLFRDQVGALSVSYPELLRDAGQVTAEQVRIRQRHYVRNGVDLVHGRARLSGPHEVAVEGGQGSSQGSEALEAEHIVIATGARPYRPPDVDF